MTVAIDTNILVYVEGVDSEERRAAAVAVIDTVRRRDRAIIPAQSLGELYNVLVRKAHWQPENARQAVLGWRNAMPVAPTTERAMLAATQAAVTHRLGIWDSVMICVAAENGCRLLLSEDLQDGFTCDGVTVVNPFATPRHPLLAALLQPGDTG
jgi:predicted nucleic acid-binding protein